jgi:hypothetical protein
MSGVHCYALACNAPGCEVRFQTLHPVVASARVDAAALGWTTRRDPARHGFYYVEDFCPDHSSATSDPFDDGALTPVEVPVAIARIKPR